MKKKRAALTLGLPTLKTIDILVIHIEQNIEHFLYKLHLKPPLSQRAMPILRYLTNFCCDQKWRPFFLFLFYFILFFFARIDNKTVYKMKIHWQLTEIGFLKKKKKSYVQPRLILFSNTYVERKLFISLKYIK